MAKPDRARFDVLVIGGGPAGLAAAARAAERGATVGIVDDNPKLGGQIWRASCGQDHPDTARWAEQLRRANVTIFAGSRVVHQIEPGVLLAEQMQSARELRYDRLVLATGARERFLPFPGWTLPNVFGAGGLQAMVKCGLPVTDKKVLVAGSGPLLLAVAAYLRNCGARILMICEQTSARALAQFGVSLWREPAKLAQALRLKMDLAGIPFATRTWPIEAHGSDVLESVVISRSGRAKAIACDYLACGFHLIPNTELAALLGCTIESGFVSVNDLQETSVSGVFCAGEPTGIGGLELALIEGQIAGLAASGQIAEARQLFRQRRQALRFTRGLEKTFRLSPELQKLAKAETIVCRCEDVTYSRLRLYQSWTAAKLQTRCGMGACQGRVCGPVTQFLFKWNPDSVRPPIFPARVESLALKATAVPNS
jgi:NADPH-dependent 2,4-dienoyl-CoA reductase/sulfur reductase-like enzyme